MYRQTKGIMIYKTVQIKETTIANCKVVFAGDLERVDEIQYHNLLKSNKAIDYTEDNIKNKVYGVPLDELLDTSNKKLLKRGK